MEGSRDGPLQLIPVRIIFDIQAWVMSMFFLGI